MVFIKLKEKTKMKENITRETDLAGKDKHILIINLVNQSLKKIG